MRIETWGNTLAVRLPAALVDALSLREGDEIETADHTPSRARRKARFKQGRRARDCALLRPAARWLHLQPGRDQRRVTQPLPPPSLRAPHTHGEAPPRRTRRIIMKRQYDFTNGRRGSVLTSAGRRASAPAARHPASSERRPDQSPKTSRPPRTP